MIPASVVDEMPGSACRVEAKMGARRGSTIPNPDHICSVQAPIFQPTHSPSALLPLVSIIRSCTPKT